LPCGDSICEYHLNEANVLKDNSIKCMVSTCKRKFNLDSNVFIPNKTVKSLLDKETFLSDEEKSLKKCMQELLKKLDTLSDEYRQSKSNFKTLCHDRFQEVYHRMDIHRQNLKDLIDEIFYVMMRETNDIEISYSNNLFKRLEATEFLTASHYKNRANRIENLKSAFRDVNVDLKWLREQREQHEKAIALIEQQLNEMSQAEENLNEIIFKPNLSLDKDSFGLLDFPRGVKIVSSSQSMKYTFFVFF